MNESILTSTKKILGLAEDYTVFDNDIIFHINTAFATLYQIGIGPNEGFMIEDATALWGDFVGTDQRLAMVKTYVYLRVRLLFDPPSTSFHIQAIQDEIRQQEWRLNVQREETRWVDPDPKLPDDDLILDGGGP